MSIGSRVAIVVGLITIAGTGISIFDVRYAMAGDVDAVQAMIQSEVSRNEQRAVQAIEDKIEDTDDSINRLQIKRSLNPSETMRLLQLKARKEKYIRRLAQ